MENIELELNTTKEFLFENNNISSYHKVWYGTTEIIKE